MNKKVIAGILCAVIVVAGGAVVIVNRKAADKSEKIALLGKSADNAFFENAARSFQETVEAEGGTADVFYPDSATADAQSKILNDLHDQDYDAICISANDVNALQADLQKAMDAVLDISGGEGDFAILSATSKAVNQNAWISAMKSLLSDDDKYSKLNLIEVAY